MPNISVILPCYNVENWIDRCMESIMRQTIGLDAFEVICVDDCSTDRTMGKLKKWEEKYPDNILIVESQINARQGAARNIGLQYARGEYIAFIDSDDWVELDYLEKLFGVTKNGEYEIVCCGYERDFSKELSFFGNTEFQGRTIEIKDDNARKKYLMVPQVTYSAWGKIFRKDFLVDNELFFPENLTYEDAGWGSLVNLYIKKVFISETKLYHYFVNDISTVLKKNSNHHLDCLTVHTWVWAEYSRRDFYERFRNELEIEHIYSGYLSGLKMAILRYEIPDYNVYLLLRELMLPRIGNYKENPYVKMGCFSELHMLMLTALDTPLSKSQFYEFAENIKRIGI